MNWAGIHEGIRRMRFEALLERHEDGELSQVEAAEMLGMCERWFRRWQIGRASCRERVFALV